MAEMARTTTSNVRNSFVAMQFQTTTTTHTIHAGTYAALNLLPLTSIELNTRIQEELMNNPLLEVEETPEEYAPYTFPDFQTNTLLSIDTHADTLATLVAPEPTIYTLLEQEMHALRAKNTATLDLMIFQAIVQEITPEGFLSADNAMLWQRVSQMLPHSSLSHEAGINRVEVWRQYLIKNFMVFGTGCQTLKEFISLQLDELYQAGDFKEKPLYMQKIINVLENPKEAAKKLSMSEFSECVEILKTLDQKPYNPNDMTSQFSLYILPDVSLEIKKHSYQLRLCRYYPTVRINHHYKTLCKQALATDQDYIVRQLSLAHNFINAIKLWERNMLNLAKRLVHHQIHFLQSSPQPLKPLTMQTISNETTLSVSTISRLTKNKYLETPRGLFEFRQFFSSATNNDGISQQFVLSRIKNILHFSPKKLKDDEIVTLLNQEGIHLSRRTVCKYRHKLFSQKNVHAIPSY